MKVAVQNFSVLLCLNETVGGLSNPNGAPRETKINTSFTEHPVSPSK